jgi:type I restriction enzyme S subunit
MSKVKLGEVAIEHKETCKGSKDGYPIVGLEHLVPEEVALTAWDEGSDNTFTKMFRKGNVLFGRRRAYLKKAAVAPFDGICSGDITVIEAIPDRILPELLPFIIQNDDLFDFAVGKSAGSLSPRVKWEHLKNYEFELPDMDKQRELAELLWAMDATKKSYQKLIAATDELVKSQFIDMFGAPLSNEKGWSLKRIGDLFSLISRGKQPSYVDHSSVRVVNQACIYWDRFNFENVKYHDLQSGKKTLPVKKDCILINSTGTGTLGRCNVFPELTDGYVYVVDSHVTVLAESHDVNAYFFKCFLQREDVQKKIYAECVNGSTNQIELSKEKLSDVLLIVPPMELQERFAAFVRQSDKSKFELEQALSELTATYKRIITENLG